MAASTAKDARYARLGGYDAIAAMVGDLLPRLHEGPLRRGFGPVCAILIP
jgi:hypothetical protein